MNSSTAPIVWAIAGRALPGETESGDASIVVPLDNGILMAVIDGLGHGPLAAVAAQQACKSIEAHATSNLSNIIHECHIDLAHTRGAVITLALFDIPTATLSWVGIGNVEAMLFSDRRSHKPYEQLVQRGGVVGSGTLPTLRPSTVNLTGTNTLVLASDGIVSRFSSDISLEEEPQKIAGDILENHARPTDDALVLVARWSPPS